MLAISRFHSHKTQLRLLNYETRDGEKFKNFSRVFFNKVTMEYIHYDRRLGLKFETWNISFFVILKKNCNIFYQRMGRGIFVKVNDPILDAKVHYFYCLILVQLK